jgi:hypothetical protein
MIRGPRPTDQSYIASTWIRNLGSHAREKHGPAGGLVAKQVDAVLDRRDTRALIRHAPGDIDTIYAWVVYCAGPSVPTVYYVYTRKEHRRKRYAAELLKRIGASKDGAIVFLMRGPGARKIEAAYPSAVYMPLEEFMRPS